MDYSSEQATNVRVPRALFVTDAVADSWPTSLTNYEVDATIDDYRLSHLLKTQAYELVILDANTLGEKLELAALTLRTHFPDIMIGIIPEARGWDTEFISLHETDSWIARNPDSDEFGQLLRRITRSTSHRQTLTQANRSLKRIQECLLHLHNLPHNSEFIFHALELLVKYCDLYGASVLLVEGTISRLYAVGSAGSGSRYNQNILVSYQDNGYLRTINTGLVHVYRDVRVDNHPIRIPIFADDRSAIFLPLLNGTETRGALGLYRTVKNDFANLEIQDFRTLADHLALALGHVIQQADHQSILQSSDLVLSAWETLTAAKAEQDLMRILRNLAQTYCDSSESIVWLYGEADPLSVLGSRHNLSANAAVQAVFASLVNVRTVQDIIDVVNMELKTTLVWAKQMQSKPLGKLFEVMNAQYIVFMPITDSTRLLGMMVAGFTDADGYLRQIVERLERVVMVAGRALERLTLIDVSIGRIQRLETALGHVSDGIILIGENDKVDYASAQLEALLGLTPADLHYQNGRDLLRLIANQTVNSEQSLSELFDAFEALLTTDQVEVSNLKLSSTGRSINVCFLAFAHRDWNIRDRAIVIREDSARVIMGRDDATSSVKAFLKQHPFPHLKLREIANTLMDDSDILTTGNTKLRRLIMRNLDREIELSNLAWNNLLALAHVQSDELALDFEYIDLNELIQLVLDRRLFRAYYRRFNVTPLASSPEVNVDVNQMSHALINIINYVLKEASSTTQISIHYAIQYNHVLLTISNDFVGNGSENVMHLFAETGIPIEALNLSPAEYGMYVARKIVEKHGGHIEATFNPQTGVIVSLDLPRERTDDLDAPRLEITDTVKLDLSATSVPRRENKRIALFQGQSLLTRQLRNLMEVQGFEIIPLVTGETANLRDMRVGLIVIDAAQELDDPLDVYRGIRLHSQVPVVIVGDQSPDEKRAQAINLGVEDYISSPVTKDELAARINVLFNRVNIPDRVRAPLRVNDLVIDFTKRQTFLAGKPVELTRLEYDLLQTLATNAGHVLTHEQLLTQVWGPEYRNETQYLWVNIRRLRQKIERDPSHPIYVRTQPRTGYFFNSDT